MIPQGRHEDMEPPDCNRRDDDWFCEQCGSLLRDDATELCPDCEQERDEVNGIVTNGTAETATLTLPKLRTLDGKPTCALNVNFDHLACPLIRTAPTGWAICGWTCHPLNLKDGYLRPCENCPIHKSP